METPDTITQAGKALLTLRYNTGCALLHGYAYFTLRYDTGCALRHALKRY